MANKMSRALLLSRKAEADAKPELEIYADDVILHMVQPLVSLMKPSFSISPVAVFHAKWRVLC